MYGLGWFKYVIEIDILNSFFLYIWDNTYKILFIVNFWDIQKKFLVNFACKCASIAAHAIDTRMA